LPLLSRHHSTALPSLGRQDKRCEVRFARGLVFDADNLKLGEYLDLWLADSVADTVGQTTFERYEQIVRVHIRPALGTLKVKYVTPAHVRGLYREKLQAMLSARTVQYVHVTLHKALKQAVADGLTHAIPPILSSRRRSGRRRYAA